MTIYHLPQPFPPFSPSEQQSGKEKQLSEWGMLATGKTLGKRTVVQGTPGTQAPVDILTLSGEDDNALNLTICLCPPNYSLSPTAPSNVQDLSSSQTNGEILVSNPGSNELTPDVLAILDWGIGGVSNRAEIDFLNGANINISASYVRLRAAVSPISPSVGHVPYTVLSAFVSAGVARNEVAQRTIHTAMGPGASSAIYAVPPFAKKMRANSYSIAPGNVRAESSVTIEMYANPSGLSVLAYFTIDPGEEVAIPSSAQYFRFINPNAMISLSTSLIFELSL